MHSHICLLTVLLLAQYIKLDWCGDIKKQVFDGSSAHRDFANAVNKSGRAMYLEVVAGYFFLGRDVAEVANSYRFCEDHHDSWSSSSEAVTCRVDLNSNVTGAPGGASSGAAKERYYTSHIQSTRTHTRA